LKKLLVEEQARSGLGNDPMEDTEQTNTNKKRVRSREVTEDPELDKIFQSVWEGFNCCCAT
jgi:hypothetical protein